MKKEEEEVINSLLGVKPIKINSALLTAQNRVRNYWTNIKGVTQPCDKHIKLQHIIKDGYAPDVLGDGWTVPVISHIFSFMNF